MSIDWAKIQQTRAKDAKENVAYYESHPSEVSSMLTEIGVNHPASLYIASLQWMVGDMKRQIESLEAQIKQIEEERDDYRGAMFEAQEHWS